MKLVINYDFWLAIKNVNEPTGPLKVIRNNKYRYMIYAPLWYTMDRFLLEDDPKATLGAILCSYGIVLSIDLARIYSEKKNSGSNMDIYAKEASNKLIKLSSQLQEINIKTNYDMLLKSELYDKKYKIELNKDKIPFLKEEKYILVPSYGFDEKEKETSILQEHVLGSSSYILSVGEPDKIYRKVLVKA